MKEPTMKELELENETLKKVLQKIVRLPVKGRIYESHEVSKMYAEAQRMAHTAIIKASATKKCG